MLICDLGNFTVESDLQQKDNVPHPDATKTELQEHLYDKFLIKISDVKVLLADSGKVYSAVVLYTGNHSPS